MTDRSALPDAAQRWLERVLPANTPVPTRVKVSQTGTLESNGRWLRLRAEGTYWVRPLAFEWRARLRTMLGMWVVATDGQADGDGWSGAKLWGLMSIGERRGPELERMQLVRNLAELAWLPELAVADPDLRWTEAGDDAFELRVGAAEAEIMVRFDLDGAGDVVRASCPGRPYDVPEGFDDAPWRYELSDHRDIGGIRVPASAVATYELPDGPWEYLRVEITDIERFHGSD